MKNLRQVVSELMVRIHRISPELADLHVREMEPSEVKWRFLFYVRSGLAGMELSVASATLRAGYESSTRFSRPATMTARPRRSTLFPLYPMPDSELENRVRKARRSLPRQVPESETENRESLPW
jgi:hypothetical protein